MNEANPNEAIMKIIVDELLARVKESGSQNWVRSQIRDCSLNFS